MISLIVPVMNRSDRIIPCLSTWIDHEEVDEVLIVDWSSKIPIYDDESLSQITKHSKTKVVRVNDETSFMAMSFSLNVALQNAKYDLILKCDIDYQLINEDIFKILREHQSNLFFCGTAPKKWDFHGFAFFSKEKALFINGYNEKIRGWGWDDEDFYRRLEKIGLKRVVIKNIDEFLYHIPHDDDLRTANYQIDQKNKYRTNRKNELTALEGDCGCLSTYQIIIEKPQYKEILRIK